MAGGVRGTHYLLVINITSSVGNIVPVYSIFICMKTWNLNVSRSYDSTVSFIDAYDE